MAQVPRQSPSAMHDPRPQHCRKFPARGEPHTNTSRKANPTKTAGPCRLSALPVQNLLARASGRACLQSPCPFRGKQISLSAARGTPGCLHRASEFPFPLHLSPSFKNPSPPFPPPTPPFPLLLPVTNL